jgi:sporulation protein YlmC with PRC-barrel domain
MWKKKDKEEKEKVISYLRSRSFPWNFIFEDLEEDPIQHFVPYAIQMCEGKGISKKTIGDEDVRDVIAREVREAVNDYLFEPEDMEMIKMHGKLASTYPFAFSQSLVYTILYRLGLTMDDVVDVNAISALLGHDAEEIRKRELAIRNLIAKNEKKAMKMFSKIIVNKKVITAGGEWVGSVGDIVFDDEKGSVEGLIINHRKGSGLKKSRISMGDVRLNMYSKNIILKYSNYNKK